MGSPFLTLPLAPPLGRRKPKSPCLRLGECPIPARTRADVKARFLDFKPATYAGGTFPTGTMPCPRKTARSACRR